jgi:hypothetical protein
VERRTLGWLAAKTDRVKLLTVVTAVVYREPGLLDSVFRSRTDDLSVA